MTVRILSFLAAATLFAACTSEKPAGEQQATEGSQPAAAASKTVTVKGSDTLVILAQRLAERLMAENQGMTVQVTGGGSGTGIAALINGTTDIATASRAMKDAEKKQVEQKRGAPAIEHAVALDGLAVYVNEKNPIQAFSLEQLEGIYTGQIKNWKELGGADAPILLYGRENNSGTYAYFKEEVLADEDFAAETQSLPGTAAVVNAVSKDPNAIGYGGIAYGSGIRAVPVSKETGGEAVEPSLENVTSGKYPISRSLFMYTAGEPTGAVKAYIDYAKSDAGQKIASEVGYYPLPKKAAAAPAPAAPAGTENGQAGEKQAAPAK
ncbi:phosphate ABC transporter substrate-binding protein [Vulgatibacter sp.]|uniref:phosphate ABC transporter substrate-binding protein n=1 Tax=Vulgatibacter sp. TaxID=1971226 RepID=UPI00356AE3DE